MLKKIITAIIAITIACISTVSINAENIENGNEYSETFKNSVYNSESYNKYKNDIESIYVDRTVMTDEGIRCTLVFLLSEQNNTQKQLIYVGDKDGNILMDSIATISDNSYSIFNLKNNIQTTVNTGNRGAAYICYTKVCKATAPLYGANPACSQTVGLPCGNPGRKAISKLACKFSIWILCNSLINSICIDWYEIQDVCTF